MVNKKLRPTCLALTVALFSFHQHARASDLQGVGGIILGQSVTLPDDAMGRPGENGLTLYAIQPKHDDPNVRALLIGVNEENQVAKIRAESAPMSVIDCQKSMNELRRHTENRYPNLGYYAMDTSELFFEGERSYTIECVREGDSRVLTQEYFDESL